MSGRNTKKNARKTTRAKNPCFKSEVADVANSNEKAKGEWAERLRAKWSETCLKKLVEHAPADMIPCLDVAYVADVAYDNPTRPELWPTRDQWALMELAKKAPLLTEFKRVTTYIQEQEEKGLLDKKSREFRQFVEDFLDRAADMIPRDRREFIAFILGPGPEELLG